MGAAAAIMPLVQTGMQVAGGVGGKGGQQAQGGISPQQAALAQYEMQQGLVKAANTFGGTNTGMSTMASYASPRIGAALKGAQMSAANLEAQGAAAQQIAQTQGQAAGQAAGLSSDPGTLDSTPNTGGSTSVIG